MVIGGLDLEPDPVATNPALQDRILDLIARENAAALAGSSAWSPTPTPEDAP